MDAMARWWEGYHYDNGHRTSNAHVCVCVSALVRHIEKFSSDAPGGNARSAKQNPKARDDDDSLGCFVAAIAILTVLKSRERRRAHERALAPIPPTFALLTLSPNKLAIDKNCQKRMAHWQQSFVISTGRGPLKQFSSHRRTTQNSAASFVYFARRHDSPGLKCVASCVLSSISCISCIAYHCKYPSKYWQFVFIAYIPCEHEPLSHPGDSTNEIIKMCINTNRHKQTTSSSIFPFALFFSIAFVITFSVLWFERIQFAQINRNNCLWNLDMEKSVSQTKQNKNKKMKKNNVLAGSISQQLNDPHSNRCRFIGGDNLTQAFHWNVLNSRS